MAISSKSKIAITALVDLALHQSDGAVSLDSIGERIGVSVSNLQKVFIDLRKQGIVTAKQGPGGGYTICECPSKIKVGDVARIFEAQQFFNTVQADANAAQELFEELNQYVFKILDDVTLQSLVDEKVEAIIK